MRGARRDFTADLRSSRRRSPPTAHRPPLSPLPPPPALPSLSPKPAPPFPSSPPSPARSELPRRVSVRALAFAPAATLPLESCDHGYETLVDAFVLEADAVPRLSVGSLRHLLEAAAIAAGDDTAKGRAAGAAGGAGVAGGEDGAGGSGGSGGGTGAELRVRRRRLRALGAHRRAQIRRPHPSTSFPPGRLLVLQRRARPPHLAPDYTGGEQPAPRDVPPAAGARGKAAEEGGWSLRRLDRRELAVLQVKPSMLRDHGFDRYDAALRALSGLEAGRARKASASRERDA